MSEEKAIKPIAGGAAVPSLVEVYDLETDTAVAVSRERPLPVVPLISADDPPLPIETRIGESVDVFIQDQTTPPLDFYFIQPIGSPDSLAAATAIDDTSVTVASDAGFTVGDRVGIFSGAGRFYFAQLLAKPGANVLDLDTPLDFAFSIGNPVIASTRELDVNGSVTPQTFEVRGAGTFEIDITRIMLSMITASAVDLSLFGDLAALTNGIVLRRTDTETRNIWNIKTNLDILNLAFDFLPFAAANPVQGVDGLGARYTFAGQDKHGVAVRLGLDDSLELIIQDNLTGLTQFRIIAQGHVVED